MAVCVIKKWKPVNKEKSEDCVVVATASAAMRCRPVHLSKFQALPISLGSV